MPGSGRLWLATLVAVTIASMSLAPCECREMASRPAGDSHCAAPEPAGAKLVAGCHCVCMTSAPEAAGTVVSPSGSAPEGPADASTLPGPSIAPGMARMVRQVSAPPRFIPPTLRI